MYPLFLVIAFAFLVDLAGHDRGSRDASIASYASEVTHFLDVSTSFPMQSGTDLALTSNGPWPPSTWNTTSCGGPGSDGFLPRRFGGRGNSGDGTSGSPFVWDDSGWIDSTPSNGFVYVRPIDGVSDDWPLLMGKVVPSAIARDQTVVMLPGLHGEEWQALSVISVPNGAHIMATRQTVINGNFNAGGYYDAIFTLANYALDTAAPLAVDVAFGATTFTSPTSFPAGEQLFLFEEPGNTGMQYESQGETGSGPWVVTLDRPVQFDRFTVANGATVSLMTTPTENISIDGQGATIKATQAFTFISGGIAHHCHISNFVLDAAGVTGAVVLLNFDTGGFDNLLENLDFRNGNAIYNFDVSTNERTRMTGITSSGGTGVVSGGEFITSTLCSFEGKCTNNGGPGLVLGGSSRISVSGDFSGNVQAGILVVGGSGNELLAPTCTGNGIGIQVDSSEWSPVTEGTVILGAHTSSNKYQGVYVGEGVLGTVAESLVIENETQGIEAFSDFTVDGLQTSGNGLEINANGTSGRVAISGYSGSGAAGVYVAAMSVDLSGRFSFTSRGAFAQVQGTGSVSLHDFSFLGPEISSSYGFFMESPTGTVHLGDLIDWGAMPVRSRLVATLPAPSGIVDSGPTRGMWSEQESLTSPTAQSVPPDATESASLSETGDVLFSDTQMLTQMTVTFIGSSSNTKQTVTFELLDDGTPIADATVTLPTMAGAQTANIWFGPTPIAAGHSIQCIMIPSTDLAAALTNVVVTAS
jgi:hypothetical protein